LKLYGSEAKLDDETEALKLPPPMVTDDDVVDCADAPIVVDAMRVAPATREMRLVRRFIGWSFHILVMTHREIENAANES
jgi:hypothetical protein